MCLNSERIAVDSFLFSNEEHLVYYKGFLIGIVIKFEKLTVTRNFQQIFQLELRKCWAAVLQRYWEESYPVLSYPKRPQTAATNMQQLSV